MRQSYPREWVDLPSDILKQVLMDDEQESYPREWVDLPSDVVAEDQYTQREQVLPSRMG